MTTITYPSGVIAPLPPMPVKRWTVAEYHQMIENGTLKSGDPFELLEGWIVQKMSRKPPHELALDLSQEVLRALLPAEWRLRVQTAITTGDSEPEPDIVVVRNPARRYADRHPGPADIGLLVEVAESSLTHDRTTKGRIYARAGIDNYWIINVVNRQVEVYTDADSLAAEPRFVHHKDDLPGDTIPLVLDGQEVTRIPVADLLP
jgi:Uma2 family endonuclease